MLHTLFFFGIGIVIGLEHALEADHVIAVTTLTSQTSSLRKAIRLAVFWGLGHTATLFLVGLLALVMRLTIPPTLASVLEAAVGVLLVALGLNVLWKGFRGELHFHEHEHDGAVHTHIHTHEHADEHHHEAAHSEAHDPAHHHAHHSFLVGIVHGLAGSAAMVLLIPAVSLSLAPGLVFILCFGLGSILGMVLITLLITIPIKMTERFTALHRGITMLAGAASVVAGVIVVTSFL